MKQTRTVILLAFATLLLSSCSNIPDTPKDQCKNLVESFIDEQGGYFQMGTFTIIDAVKGSEAGVEYYQMKYVAKMKCLKPGFVNTYNGAISNFTIWPVKCHVLSTTWFGDVNQECMNTEMTVGAEYTYTGKMTFAKHEQGWVLEKGL